MKTKATLQMVAIAKRIAAKNGVSVDEVLDRFNQDVEKTSFDRRDLFLGYSVITLDDKKVVSARSRSRSVGRLGSRAMVGAARKTARVKA